MYKYLFVVAFQVFLTCFYAYSGNNNSTGARSSGMANASVAVSDLWSVHHNQAGLAGLKEIQAGTCYENRFLLSELGIKGLALAIPVKAGVFGFSVSHFGFSLYNESKAGLAYALKLGGNISAGVQINYQNVFIAEGYGNRGVFTAESGIMAEIAPGLTLGAHLSNPTRSGLSEYNNERLPTIMRLGLNYKISDKVFITAETLKSAHHPPLFKTGMEYHVVEQLYLRAGVSTSLSMNSFGFGLDLKHFRLDFASSIHSVFGQSPVISLNYIF